MNPVVFKMIVKTNTYIIGLYLCCLYLPILGCSEEPTPTQAEALKSQRDAQSDNTAPARKLVVKPKKRSGPPPVVKTGARFAIRKQKPLVYTQPGSGRWRAERRKGFSNIVDNLVTCRKWYKDTVAARYCQTDWPPVWTDKKNKNAKSPAIIRAVCCIRLSELEESAKTFDFDPGFVASHQELSKLDAKPFISADPSRLISEITVDSNESLLEALTSQVNKTIVIKAGDYFFEDALSLNKCSRLTIKGDGPVRISVKIDEYWEKGAISVSACDNLILENLKIVPIMPDGFFNDEELTSSNKSLESAAAVFIELSTAVKIKNLIVELAPLGLKLEKTTNVKISNLVVRDSNNGLVLHNVSSAKIRNSRFIKIKGYGLDVSQSRLVSVDRSVFFKTAGFMVQGFFDLQLIGCRINNNQTEPDSRALFTVSEATKDSQVLLQDCTLENNGNLNLADKCTYNKDNGFVCDPGWAHGFQNFNDFNNKMKNNLFQDRARYFQWYAMKLTKTIKAGGKNKWYKLQRADPGCADIDNDSNLRWYAWVADKDMRARMPDVAGVLCGNEQIFMPTRNTADDNRVCYALNKKGNLVKSGFYLGINQKQASKQNYRAVGAKIDMQARIKTGTFPGDVFFTPLQLTDQRPAHFVANGRNELLLTAEKADGDQAGDFLELKSLKAQWTNKKEKREQDLCSLIDCSGVELRFWGDINNDQIPDLILEQQSTEARLLVSNSKGKELYQVVANSLWRGCN